MVAGQEILTADGVPLWASVTLRYRVARPELALEAAAAFTETLHAQTQLVLRDLVATVPAGQVLPQRPRLAEGLQAALAPRAAALGLELEEVGMRDCARWTPRPRAAARSWWGCRQQCCRCRGALPSGRAVRSRPVADGEPGRTGP